MAQAAVERKRRRETDLRPLLFPFPSASVLFHFGERESSSTANLRRRSGRLRCEPGFLPDLSRERLVDVPEVPALFGEFVREGECAALA